MNKFFEEPIVEVQAIEVSDVIATSNSLCPNETPFVCEDDE